MGPPPPTQQPKKSTVRTTRKLFVILPALVAVTTTSCTAAPRALTPASDAPRVEHWTGKSPYFSKTSAPGGTVGVVAMSGANDGRALRMQLAARPGVGPGTPQRIDDRERPLGPLDGC